MWVQSAYFTSHESLGKQPSERGKRKSFGAIFNKMLHHNECVMRLFHKCNPNQKISKILYQLKQNLWLFTLIASSGRTRTQFIINIHHHTLNIITVVISLMLDALHTAGSEVAQCLTKAKHLELVFIC